MGQECAPSTLLNLPKARSVFVTPGLGTSVRAPDVRLQRPVEPGDAELFLDQSLPLDLCQPFKPGQFRVASSLRRLGLGSKCLLQPFILCLRTSLRLGAMRLACSLLNLSCLGVNPITLVGQLPLKRAAVRSVVSPRLIQEGHSDNTATDGNGT